MFSTLLQPTSVRLYLLNDVIFVHPPDRPDDTHDDQTLRGVVEIKVPSPRRIAGVRVHLEGVQTLAFPEAGGTLRWEDKVILHKVVEIGCPSPASPSTSSTPLSTLSATSSSPVYTLSATPASSFPRPPAIADSLQSITHPPSLVDDDPPPPPSTAPDQPLGALPIRGPRRTSGSPVDDLANAVFSSLSVGTGRDDKKGKRKEKETDSKEAVAAKKVDKGGLDLDKGIHGFEFTFIIPSTIASYERSRYGRIQYFVWATAHGAGRARSSVETRRHEAFFIPNPGPEGGPLPLEVSQTGFNPSLGAFDLRMLASSITVGGTFLFGWRLPSPSPPLVVWCVRLSLEEAVDVWSEERKAWVTMPPHRTRLWERGRVPGEGPRETDKEKEKRMKKEKEEEERKRRPGRTSAPLPFSVAASRLGGVPPAPASSTSAGAAAASSSRPRSPASPTDIVVSPSSPRSSTTASPIASSSSSAKQAPSSKRAADRVSAPSQPRPTPLRAPGQVSSDGSWSVRGLVRLPDHDNMRPGTPECTRTDIRVRHTLVVEVFHERGGEEEEEGVVNGRDRSGGIKVFTLRKAALIPSCCCTLETLHLPAYSPSPFPSPSDGKAPTSYSGFSPHQVYFPTGPPPPPFDLAQPPQGKAAELKAGAGAGKRSSRDGLSSSSTSGPTASKSTTVPAPLPSLPSLLTSARISPSASVRISPSAAAPTSTSIHRDHPNAPRSLPPNTPWADTTGYFFGSHARARHSSSHSRSGSNSRSVSTPGSASAGGSSAPSSPAASVAADGGGSSTPTTGGTTAAAVAEGHARRESPAHAHCMCGMSARRVGEKERELIGRSWLGDHLDWANEEALGWAPSGGGCGGGGGGGGKSSIWESDLDFDWEAEWGDRERRTAREVAESEAAVEGRKVGEVAVGTRVGR